MNREWEKVGEVGVDTGMIWIGDPCYVVSKDASHVWSSWKKFLLDLFKIENKGVANFGNIGVAISSGYGDGRYEVFVKREDGVMKEAKIVFFDNNEVEY
jgi:hypothetical protein